MPAPARKHQRNHPGAVGVVMALAVLTVLALVVGREVFVVRQITVEGNQYCSAEEVAQSAGIQHGDGMFSIDPQKVRDGINANRYLEYIGMWRDFPNRVILTVRERSPSATLTSRGMLVVLGEAGVVLEKTAQIDVSLRVPLVTGVDVRSAEVGQYIQFEMAGQFEAIFALLAEMDRQEMTPEVAEVNVAVLDNLYWVTADGLQVVLGDSAELSEKIGMVRGVTAQLRGETELRGAVLDVSSVRFADFRSSGDETAEGGGGV